MNTNSIWDGISELKVGMTVRWILNHYTITYILKKSTRVVMENDKGEEICMVRGELQGIDSEETYFDMRNRQKIESLKQELSQHTGIK